MDDGSCLLAQNDHQPASQASQVAAKFNHNYFLETFLEFYLLFSIAYFYSHNRHNQIGVLSSSRRTFKHGEHKKIQEHQPKHQIRHFVAELHTFERNFYKLK